MDYIKQYSGLTPQELRQLSYKRRYKSEVPAWDDSMVLLTKLVGDRLGSTPDVLDLGCGRGNFVLDELGEVFGRKVGFDVSSSETDGNKSVRELVFGDAKKLPFPDASFDLVVSLWVSEHIAEPEQVFAEITRVLKPGGRFAFVTPNSKSALILLRSFMSQGLADRLLKKYYGREEHDVFPVCYLANDKKSLCKLAQKTGLIPVVLRQNADPSYTSFNEVTYRASKLFSRIPWSFSRPHIVGVFQKVS